MGFVQRKVYIDPELSVELVSAESGFAAGSAAVTPVSQTNTVMTEWEVGEEITRELEW